MALASSVRIEIGGQKIPDFIDISIRQRMHALHEFQVTCRMDAFEEPDDFVVNKSKKFIGSTIVIEIDAAKPGGDGSVPGLFFKGIIHSVRAVKSDLSNEDKIVLVGSSPEFLLSDHPGCRSFENCSLNQVVEAVVKPCPRDILTVNNNPAYKEKIPYCVQYRETSLQFLQRLASRYGEWLYYNGKELNFGAARSKTEELVLGKDLDTLDFSLRLKASGFSYVTYDYMGDKHLSVSTDDSTGRSQQNEVGKYAFDQSFKRLNQTAVQYFPAINADPSNYGKLQKDALETEASAIALGMSGVEATGENFSLAPGVRVRIRALTQERNGQVDYGEYTVDTIDHYCNNLMNYGNRFTAFPAEARVPGYSNPEAVACCEPQRATVTDNKDPDKLGRVRVTFGWQKNSGSTPWIRVVAPYAANERGFYFIPEISDEVMVGFEGGDVEKPYVMGSLYNGKNKMSGAWPNPKNSFKGIITSSKLRIEFDDEKKTTTIDTPGGNKVVISDDQKSVLITDQHSNSLKMDSSGISLDSPKDIRLTAKGSIKVEAVMKVEISSRADVKVEGMNVTQEAMASFTAKGTASAEISASGPTTVKGAMVMIN